MKKLEIRNVKFFKNLVILKFNGIDNINDIEMYKGRDLWVPREEAQELDEDEYYIGDLIGMEVVLEDNTHFGTLKDVMETGANDVYVVELPDHQEVLLPAIKECILDVDLEEKCDDCTFDERTFVNEFPCFDPFSGNDPEWNEYQHYRPCH